MAGTHAVIGDDLGTFIKAYNQIRRFRDDTADFTVTPIPKLRADAEPTFHTDEVHRFIWTAYSAWFDSVTGALNGLISSMISGPFAVWATEFLRPDIDSTTTDLLDIIRDLQEEMLDDNKDILENTITLSSGPTADSENIGDGVVTVSLLEPIEKRSEERIQTEDFLLQTSKDSFNDGRTPGDEQFNLTGTIHPQGPRVRSRFSEGANSNRIVNGGFETWPDPAQAPDSWTIVAGTAGTHIIKAVVAAEHFRGDSGLKLDGDGIITSIEIKQPETDFADFASTTRLRTKGFYVLSAQILSDTVTGPGETLEIFLDGTGYTTGASEKITITDPGTVAFTHFGRVVIMPNDIPDDMALHIKYSSGAAIPSGHFFAVDDLELSEMTEWPAAGIKVHYKRGANDTVAGRKPDHWKFSTTNSFVSLFQTFMTRVTDNLVADIRAHPNINRMLPSAVAASAEYAESKAT